MQHRISVEWISCSLSNIYRELRWKSGQIKMYWYCDGWNKRQRKKGKSKKKQIINDVVSIITLQCIAISWSAERHELQTNEGKKIKKNAASRPNWISNTVISEMYSIQAVIVLVPFDSLFSLSVCIFGHFCAVQHHTDECELFYERKRNACVDTVTELNWMTRQTTIKASKRFNLLLEQNV